ncbi:unnamed protein product [Plutella xylostella]|uniref:(diamondback moth) hypothetical protein n=1 Tax=Plutella xylostella TaxID=51655 RepID=A0A8S4DHB6_PLUXY|nr:unnamed protein product [Plutella xylostella]
MDSTSNKIRNCAVTDCDEDIADLLRSGFDPNFEGGWPIRLAARHGSFAVVRQLIQFGADPHLLGESGASTLQLAVYAGKHWDNETWSFLLSCCDSSQLADGAAVAIIFKNIPAFKKIMETGRCNTHIPTTLTGKTLEQLAKGYKLHYLLSGPTVANDRTQNTALSTSPRIRPHRTDTRRTLTPQPHPSQRNLSPSVARFFHQTAAQTSLAPSRSPTLLNTSPRQRLGNSSPLSNWPILNN